MNERRVCILALALSVHATLAGAQPTSGQRRVGVFMPSREGEDVVLVQPFFDRMRALGWVEGKTVAYDRVYGDDRAEAMPRLAIDLVGRRPDLIVALGPTASKAVRQATATIPIVFSVVVDPVAAGLVESLARPGGNVSGVTQSIAESLAPKRIQLLREVVPGIKRVGILGNSLDPGSITDQAALAPLAAPLGLTLVVANATNPDQFDASVASLIEQRVEAILVANGIAVGRRRQMMEMTQRARIPVVGFNAPMAEAGALLALGPSISDQIARSANLVDKILRGVRPADIPVEAGNRIELVINLKSARALGISIPQSLLLQADRALE
jgi:putative tryptophan/tyrosine transport system substrate-binding protein